MTDYTTPSYKTSEVARASMLGPSALRNYFAREHFAQIGLDRREPDGDGLPTLFSLRDALTIATAARLIRAGAEPKPAFQAALRWAHTGSTDRLPGHVFDEGLTLLLFYPETGHNKVVAANGAVALDELFSDPSASRPGFIYPVPIVVVLNDICDTVFAALRV